MFEHILGLFGLGSQPVSSARKKTARKRQRRLLLDGLESRCLMAVSDFTIYRQGPTLGAGESFDFRPDIATIGDVIYSTNNTAVNNKNSISLDNGLTWTAADPGANMDLVDPQTNTTFNPVTPESIEWGDFTGEQDLATDTINGQVFRTMEYGPQTDLELQDWTNGFRLAVARTETELRTQQWNYYNFPATTFGLEKGYLLLETNMEVSNNFLYLTGHSYLPETDADGVKFTFQGTVWTRIGLASFSQPGDLEMGVTNFIADKRITMISGAKDTMYGGTLLPTNQLLVYSWNDNDLGPSTRTINNVSTLGITPVSGGTAPISTGWLGQGYAPRSSPSDPLVLVPQIGFMWDSIKKPNANRPNNYVRTVMIYEDAITNTTVQAVAGNPDLFHPTFTVTTPEAQATRNGDVAITVTQTSASATSTKDGTTQNSGDIKNVVYINDSYSRASSIGDPAITNQWEVRDLPNTFSKGTLLDVNPIGLVADDIFTDTWISTGYKVGASKDTTANFYWFGRQDPARSPSANLTPISLDAAQDEAHAGEQVSLKYVIRNNGILATTAGYTVSFYASTDGTISTTDKLIGSASLPVLNGQTNTSLQTSTFTLPPASDPFWTSVGSGQYFIGMVVDPANTIKEYIETDNSNLGAGIDVTSIFPAEFGGNDSRATATDLGIISGRREYKQLGIDAAVDQDFYQFTAPYDGTFSTSIQFKNGSGNLDLFLLDSSGTQLFASNSTTNNTELITLPVLKDQTYFIRVAGAGGAANSYDFVTDYRVPADNLETHNGTDPATGKVGTITNNDAQNVANDLGVVANYASKQLAISSSTDADFLRFILPTPGAFTARITFPLANGNLKITLRDASGAVLATSNPVPTGALLQATVTNGHVYFLQIDGGGKDTNYYDLSFTGVVPPLFINGTTVQINGTTSADTIEFLPNVTSPFAHVIRLNGVDYSVPDSVITYNINGNLAKDVMIINGSETVDDLINVSLNRALYAYGTATYTFNLTNIEGITVNGAGGNDRLTATGPQAVSFFGGDGNDTLTGSSLSDLLVGGNGNDILTGFGGNDTLRGEIGDDTLLGGEGNDFLAGGSGNDRYVFVNPVATQTDTMNEFTNSGTDTFDFSSVTQNLNVNLTNPSSLATFGTTIKHTILSSTTGGGAFVENLIGGSGNDFLTGNAANNVLIGGEGNDLLTGGAGNDTYIFNDAVNTQVDRIAEAPNSGTDRLDFGGSSIGATIDLAKNFGLALHGKRTVNMHTANYSIHIEDVQGSQADDIIFGNAGNNWIDGGSGSDKLTGRAGNDTYHFSNASKAETDTISELLNAGTDLVTFANISTGVKVNLADPLTIATMLNRTVNVPSNQSRNLENLTGGQSDDILIGNDANNLILGTTGRDWIIGGKGIDTLNGGADDDILMGGTVTFNAAQRDLVFNEWRSGNNYNVRVDHLRGPVSGVNGLNFFTPTTVVDDFRANILTGDLDQDYFFKGFSGVITDRVTIPALFEESD